MQNLRTPPSTSSSPSSPSLNPLSSPPRPSTNGYEAASTNGSTTNGSVAPVLPPDQEPDFIGAVDASVAIPAPLVEAALTVREVFAPPIPNVREIMRRRPSSLRMGLRYLRTLGYFAWLFARLLFWHWFLARYTPEYVKRGNLKRWQRYAREFRGFAIQMGGLMIKAGQFVSTRSDILPPEITDELASLRDEVPGVPIEKIRTVIQDDLGPIPTRFAQFDEVAVAAASLGQVHRARLHNGDKIVVKVLRPGIVEICHTDLAAMNVVAHVAMRFRFISRRMDVVALTEEFGRVLLEELSYRHEAGNAARFQEMFKNDLGVYIPRVYNEHSTDRVITIEDVTTIKLDDYVALQAAGIDRNALAKRLLDTYLRQIFEERFFHADPHPGNLFVYPLPESAARDPRYAAVDSGRGRPFYLIFIDFGMTASLSPQLVNGLIGTITSVFSRDTRKLIESYSQLGFILPGADLDRLEEAARSVFDQVWGLSMEQMRDVSFDSMAVMGKEFSDLLYTMPFQVPQDFIYLGRTVSILSGLCTSLDPNINPWSELAPYAQKLVIQPEGGSPNVLAQAAGSLGNLIGGGVMQSLFSGNGGGALMQVGQSLFGRGGSSQDVLARLESGDLKLRVESAGNLQRQLNRIEAQGKRQARAVIFGSLLITSTLFYANGDTVLAVIGYGLSALAYLGYAWSNAPE